MNFTASILCVAALVFTLPRAWPQPAIPIPNAGFELKDARGFAAGWERGLGPGTQGAAELDSSVTHSGARSLRLSDATPTEAYKYVLVNSGWLPARPNATYLVRCWVRGRSVGQCFIGMGFEGAGEARQALPVGDYDWRPITFRVTTPAGCARIRLLFIADGVTGGLWVDDVAVDASPVQLANLPEVREPWPYATWYPRTPGPCAPHLVVADLTGADDEVGALLVALQGLVNRRGPRLYLINKTNPPRYDDLWLAYMREKGYTQEEERLANPLDALKRFRSAYRGLVVWDDDLPGSVNAAWMLAGLKDALPASPRLARTLGAPIVEDLRGRWKRNVDAYRFIFDRYWPKMSHHLLAWEYPGSNAISSRDVMVQQKVFLFWVSSPLDNEKGADPVAEMEFVEELLSKTPGNVPVMGWPMYGAKGVEEYTAVRLLSEYAKWVPGTGYSSNGTVHSAIEPPKAVFRQRFRSSPPPAVHLRRDRVYLSIDIMDSGDAHWYWQLYQRGIWADPARGSVPIGYAMNMTLVDALPLVAQWYYEHMTPADSFFGFLYMNAPVYASRFRPRDRDRIWAEYVALSDRYRKRLDMDGIELYNGGSSGPTAPVEVLRRFTRGMKGLRYILADLGRHADITPANANTLLDGVPVFHTLTAFRVWTTPEETQTKRMETENRWLLGEIVANTPKDRPAFMSALAISWWYYPSWLEDLHARLPAEYTPVSPGDLARLYLESRRAAGTSRSR